MPSIGINPAAKEKEFNANVNVERDLRIAAGFYYGSYKFDWDEATKSRVTGAASLAGFAISAGALANDLRWHSGDADFVWILQDNSTLPLDAQGMFAVSQSAMAHEAAHVFAARAIKGATTKPVDYTDDMLWPAVVPT
jgi:hypothetical protein